jgi:hypothetical protein
LQRASEATGRTAEARTARQRALDILTDLHHPETEDGRLTVPPIRDRHRPAGNPPSEAF